MHDVPRVKGGGMDFSSNARSTDLHKIMFEVKKTKASNIIGRLEDPLTS